LISAFDSAHQEKVEPAAASLRQGNSADKSVYRLSYFATNTKALVRLYPIAKSTVVKAIQQQRPRMRLCV
jgi:hypothetical protein